MHDYMKLIVVAVIMGYIPVAVVIALLTRSLAVARWQASHDELTGLMRRQVASRYVAERRRGGRATTVVIFDLDQFKSVNDKHGHRAGDQLLAAVGSRLEAQARQLDGCAARIGGDEFLLVLPAVEPAEHASQIDGVLRSLSAPVPADGFDGAVTIYPSATAGLASAVDSEWTWLLSAADFALHKSKVASRRVRVASGERLLPTRPAPVRRAPCDVGT